MICFQRWLKRTVRFVGGLRCLSHKQFLEYAVQKLLDRFAVVVAIHKAEHIRGVLLKCQERDVTASGSLLHYRMRSYQRVDDANLPVIGPFKQTVRVFHSAILSAGTRKRNGRFVLAYAGGNA